MNKLVSKNPVLRFKLGKKIVKALSGTILDYSGRYLNPLGSVAAAYDIYNNLPNITKSLRDFYYGYDRDAYLKRLNKLKVRRNTPRVIIKNGKRFWYDSNGGMTDLELYNKRNNSKGPFNVSNPNTWGTSIETVTVTPRTSKPSRTPTYYATRAYRSNIPVSGLNSRAAVMEYLKKLNRFGANIKEDGIWGNETQAAYELYGRFNPGHDDDRVQAQILGSKPTTTVVDTASINPSIITTVSTNSTVPTNSWIAKAKSLNNLHYNIDPRFIIAKQGAKLVSRNPVERFLQGRNLPTAPKAEDRYKNGKRYLLPYYKEVWTPANGLTHGASIRQYVEPVTPYYNDTTYVEIPEHTSFVNVKPRVASTNSEEDLNSPILNKNGWPTGHYKFKFNNSPEYETLKRRFNTAWSLAK